MKEFWNARYREEGYAYGNEPNVFFKEQLDQIPAPGRILLPAEGEGRNAVYAAERGWEVVAFDISASGREKALALASERSVNIDYQTGAFDEIKLGDKCFNVIGLIYAHFPSSIRRSLHQSFCDLLCPSGRIILEGFSTQHLTYQQKNPSVGGPQQEDLLFFEKMISDDFCNLTPSLLEEIEVLMNEGKYHLGLSHVLRFVGIKQ